MGSIDKRGRKETQKRTVSTKSNSAHPKKKSTVKQQEEVFLEPKTRADWRYRYKFWHQKGIPLIAIERLAENMLTIIEEDKTIVTFNSLLVKLGLTNNQFDEFLQRSDKLVKAKGYTMFAIGANRETKALYRQIDGSVMKHQQGIYDEKWKEREIFHAELRRNTQPEGNTKVVVLKDLKDVKDL